jgi:hypothetical protein
VVKIIPISQDTERDAWLEFRRGKITGTSIGKLYEKNRSKAAIEESGVFSTKANLELYKVVAGRIAVGDDGEPPRERGIRLEHTACKLAVKKLGLKHGEYNGYVFQSEVSEYAMSSPDNFEHVDNPTWLMEIKCLSTARHLKMIFEGEIDKEFRWQVADSFLNCPSAKVLYFVLFDPRVVIDELALHIITVKREDVADDIETLAKVRDRALKQIDNILEQLNDIAKNKTKEEGLLDDDDIKAIGADDGIRQYYPEEEGEACTDLPELPVLPEEPDVSKSLSGELSDGERGDVEAEGKNMASNAVCRKQRAGKKIEETLERAKEIF